MSVSLASTPPEPRLRAEGRPVPGRDPARAPLIRIEGLGKRFGDTLALDDVSLDIGEGELFCLLGPSGCGKSTLMRLVAGFESPDRGRILLGADDLAALPAHRRPVNMMFQSYALFPHMSVAGNLAYGLKREGLPRREIAARVEEMLRLVELEGFGARRPDRLSGGQRQRVALARALAKRPRVLLLDEPLAALDRRLRQATQRELMALQTRLGTTFVMVTHDQDEAMAMATRIAVMDRGRVVQVGTPAEIYETPRTRFVAGFVGEVNLFSGRVTGGDGPRWRVTTAAGPDPLLVEAGPARPAPGQEVWVAVRPERISLCAEAPAGPDNVLAGEVAELGYFGDRIVWRVRLTGGELVSVARANTGGAPGAGFGERGRVFLSFPADAATLLTE